jgi:hypothetical protein
MKLSQLKEEIRNIIREVKLEEGFTNPKVSNPTELAKIVLGWFDFYTDYIDDGGQRRRAIQKNDNTLEWFGSHPVDVKEKAYKIILAQAKGDKSKIERTFGKHLKEVVTEEKKYDIGSGWMGNGLTIWNRAEETNGDYKQIAHISKDGTLKIYDKALPNDIKKMFQMWADTMKKGDRPGTY